MKTGTCRNQASPSAVAALLKVVTGKNVSVFALNSLPFSWSDYPDGYSVFRTTMDIHTGDYPVAVYFKGDRAGAALKTARTHLLGAGFVCQSVPSASKRRARIVVTVEE